MAMQTTSQWGSLLPKGLGNDQEASQATSAMRQSPWYQDWAKKNNLQFQGDSYGNANLNDDQQKSLYDLALKNGIGLNNKYDQIDQNGQISEAHHKLRNALIAAAIGGGALTGFGAAGIGPLSGLFGAGASAGAGAGAGAASTAAGGGSGLLASTPLSAGLFAAPTSVASGAVPAALASTTAASSPLLGLGMNLPSTQIGNGFIPAVGSTSSMGAGSGAGSTISQILASLKKPGNYADLSRILQQGATDAQGNRVIQGSFANQYDRNMLAAQTDRNATESDALKKLAQTSYILNGHSGYNPANITIAGQTRALPDYGFGYTAPSEAQKTGATALQSQLTSRLKPGGTYTPLPFSDYGTPGTGENVQNYAGQGLGIAGTIMNMFKKSGQ